MGNYISQSNKSDNIEPQEDLENIKNRIYQRKILLQDLSDEKRDIEDIVSLALDHNNSIRHASRRLKENRNLSLKAVNKDGSEIRYISRIFKNDQEIILCAMKTLDSAIFYASKKLRDDQIFMLKAIKIQGSSLRYASNRLKEDHLLIYRSFKDYPIAKHLAYRTKNNTRLIYKIFKYKITDTNHFYLKGFQYPRKCFIQFVKRGYILKDYIGILKIDNLNFELRMELKCLNHLRYRQYRHCYSQIPLRPGEIEIEIGDYDTIFPHHLNDVENDRQLLHLDILVSNNRDIFGASKDRKKIV